MSVYVEGLINCAAILVIAVLVALVSPRAYSADALVISFLVLAVGSGYRYRKKHGPLVLAVNGLALRRTLKFAAGFGTVMGPITLFLGGFPVKGVIPAVNAALLLLAIPMSTFTYLGPLLMGSWAYDVRHEP